MKTASVLFLTLFLVCVSSCESSNEQDFANEYAIQEIVLSGEIADRNSELSGLCWYKDKLLLLPQYPSRFAESEATGALFYIEKDSIDAYLENTKYVLSPQKILLYYNEQISQLQGFEGFEAMCIHEDKIFLTIETESDTMLGYLVAGIIASDLSRIDLDSSKITPVNPQSSVGNACEETMLIIDGIIYTIYEANGANINTAPQAHLFDLELNPLGEISFPNIEYRITDASECTIDNTFWAINYFWPGDAEAYNPAEDPIALKYGKGKTHSERESVERLVKFEITAEGITLVDEPPVQLLLEVDSRNWEGLVALDNQGFLICTDKFPQTILGFIKIR